MLWRILCRPDGIDLLLQGLCRLWGHFEASGLLGCDTPERDDPGDGNHGKAGHAEHYNFFHTYLMIRNDRDQRVFVKKLVTRLVICWTRSTTSVRRYSSESVS